MARIVKKISQKAGLPPGSLVYVGDKAEKKFKATLVVYNQETYTEEKLTSLEECLILPEARKITWLDVNGLQDVRNLEKLGECFSLHPLVVEDILNTNQRPKLEDYGDYLYLVLKMISHQEKAQEISSDQLSLIVGPHFVISLHENDEAIFDTIRERIKSKGKIRRAGPDYLAYSLMDLVVDHYFVILEDLGETIEEMEEELVSRPDPQTVHQIHRLKRVMIILRRAVWPLREVLSQLERQESPLIQEGTSLYIKDVYDHIIQVIDTIETFRDMLSGMLDVYLSSVSNRLNEVMKVLTIIATIFIPLTFIAGIYGMNFKYMPELDWRWGYFVVLGFMGAVFLGMLLFFRKKKWIGGP
ncbi:MAG: magnesium/cobalt transporter CorA [Deltaproteobacteria bacterium]|nr:magnesium/cobalt transporter CorA [Deltaproteobacteria bacterium]